MQRTSRKDPLPAIAHVSPVANALRSMLQSVSSMRACGPLVMAGCALKKLLPPPTKLEAAACAEPVTDSAAHVKPSATGARSAHCVRVSLQWTCTCGPLPMTLCM